MYYDSKSDFYIRQYGPKIGIAVLSIALIVSGVCIYCSTFSKSSSRSEVISADNKVEENTSNVVEDNSLKEVEESKVEEETKIEISRGLTATLKELKILQKTNLCEVISVTDNNSIIVHINSRYYEINLIGMDYSRSPSSINEIMKKDLEGKKVKVAFDKLRIKDGQVYAYLFLDDKVSYNELLLKNGLAIIKVESTNTSLLTKLVEAQKFAKSNNIGIWAK